MRMKHGAKGDESEMDATCNLPAGRFADAPRIADNAIRTVGFDNNRSLSTTDEGIRRFIYTDGALVPWESVEEGK